MLAPARLVFSAALAAALSPPTLALAEPAQQVMKNLLAAGYQIAAVTVLPPDVLDAEGSDPKNPQVLVSLQRGSAIAVCEFSSVNWENAATASMEGTTCSVYGKE